MKPQELTEHNLVFQEALTIVKEEIPLQGRVKMPRPDLMMTHKLRHSIALFEQALKINPHNWSAMWFIGKVHQRLGESQKALAWFERAYDINPSQPDISREASLCAMETGLHSKAIFFANCAAEVEPTNAGLQANLALAYLLSGRLPDAQKSVDCALAANPSDAISQTIQRMIQHFTSNRRIPPATTSALLDYWHRKRAGGLPSRLRDVALGKE